MISKIDSNFNKIWEKTLQGKVYQEAFEVTTDETYMFFTPYDLTSCTLIKSLTSDGSISLQKSLALTAQCESLVLSTDNQYVYISGYNGTPIISRVNVTDLSITKTVAQSSLRILSMYTYSAEILIVNSFNSGSSRYQHSLLDMSLSTGIKQWSMKIG